MGYNICRICVPFYLKDSKYHSFRVIKIYYTTVELIVQTKRKNLSSRPQIDFSRKQSGTKCSAARTCRRASHNHKMPNRKINPLREHKPIFHHKLSGTKCSAARTCRRASHNHKMPNRKINPLREHKPIFHRKLSGTKCSAARTCRRASLQLYHIGNKITSST